MSIYDAQYRLSWFTQSDEWECYDHAVDPYERNNIIDIFKHTERFAGLRDQLMTRHLEAIQPNTGRMSCW